MSAAGVPEMRKAVALSSLPKKPRGSPRMGVWDRGEDSTGQGSIKQFQEFTTSLVMHLARGDMQCNWEAMKEKSFSGLENLVETGWTLTMRELRECGLKEDVPADTLNHMEDTGRRVSTPTRSCRPSAWPPSLGVWYWPRGLSS